MTLASFQRALATALALSLGAPLAQAHSAFFMPSSTVLSKPQWVTIDGGIATDAFVFDGGPLKPDNLLVTAPDGSALAPENLLVGKLRSVFDLNLTQPGTYRVANAGSGVAVRYKDKTTGQNKGFRGTVAAFEKDVPADAEELQVNETVSRIETFVTVGKPSAVKPSGVGLELVAVTHPNDLYSGESAWFAFHLDGRPVADLDVAVIASGARYRDKVGSIQLKTDAQGRVTLKWPQPGLYLLEAHTKDGKTTVKQAKERRLTYGAVLEVLSQ